MLRIFISFIGSLFTICTLGVIFGVIMLAAIFLAYSSDLPDHEYLANYEPATISRVYSIDGKVMDEFAIERRLFTPIEDIPEIVKAAFVSAEDKNFYEHKGYDLLGITKAIFDGVIMGKRMRGASTITQQVTKNFLLTNEQSVERKIKELILSTRIEHYLKKDRILELYLNEIFLGQNSYGIMAAAETYFAKSLEELNLQEVAYLAALPKAPSNYHPVRQKKRAIARRNFVLREMAENDNRISHEILSVARNSPLITVQGGGIKSARLRRPLRNYFTDEIRRQVSERFGKEKFFTGGFSIRATMDTDMQRAAELALRDGLEKYDRRVSPFYAPKIKINVNLLEEEMDWRKALSAVKISRDVEDWYPAVILEVNDEVAHIGVEGFESMPKRDLLYFKVENLWVKQKHYADGTSVLLKSGLDLWKKGEVILVKAKWGLEKAVESWSLRQIPRIQGGFVAMDTNTGRVLAMQGGFSYQNSVFNRATQAKRQPGSVFKPFVYAAALDSGYSPVSIVVDAPIEINTPQGLWRPKNASNRFYGPAPLRVGIEQSRNLMTVRLAQDVGMDVVASYAERFGVYSRMNRILAASLGSQETTLYNIVSSYAMFANGGERINPTLIDRIQDNRGKTIFRHDNRKCENCSVDEIEKGFGPNIISDRERVMDEVTAYRLTSMMRGVIERGTARKTVHLDVPVAGKTGTTNESKDVWFIGFTRNIVAGCYMGFDRPMSLGKGASGGAMCGPVFQQFMTAAIKKYGAGKFDQPVNTIFFKFDRFTGMRLANNATGDNVVKELFRITDIPDINTVPKVIDGGFIAPTDIILVKRVKALPKKVRKVRVKVIKTATGKRKKIPPKAKFDTLSSGGLY